MRLMARMSSLAMNQEHIVRSVARITRRNAKIKAARDCLFQIFLMKSGDF